jgi:hypothetical protein
MSIRKPQFDLPRVGGLRIGGASSSFEDEAGVILSGEFFDTAAPSLKTWIRVSGVWKQATAWIRISGVWKQATPFVRVAGAWR